MDHSREKTSPEIHGILRGMDTSHYQPVRLTGGLPPRRGASLNMVQARAADVPILKGGTDSIIVPAARDRMLELIEREQHPSDVHATLAGSAIS